MEGLSLNAKATWTEEASAWLVDIPVEVSSDRITLHFGDSWIGWLLGLL